MCSFLLINRFGRRPLLIWTSVIQFISLFVIGGLGTISKEARTTTQNNTIAGMICLFVFFFNLAWGGLAWTIAAELCPGVSRQKIMSLGTAMFWIIAFLVTFTLPYFYDADQANLGPQIGWIYGCGQLIALAFVFFYVPETIHRSLEEISEMLDARVPARHWTTYTTRISQGAGTSAAAAAGGKEAGSDEELGLSDSSEGHDEKDGKSKKDTNANEGTAAITLDA